ncbi:hypothetical protein 65p339 [Aeromonas phage 65]|uniref:Uncharacterized protein n=2 Tax=Ishigurovirus osborne TaxID=260149 RepID=A0A219YCI4_9CAUD|nr:hypothetical protein ST65p339 [Aeromonas phage 65]ADQ53347.1 hypothetical protein 65p339 [Aeromonas phage 65]APU01708.1 hypothetical protein [Aeromonas phage 65.2]
MKPFVDMDVCNMYRFPAPSVDGLPLGEVVDYLGILGAPNRMGKSDIIGQMYRELKNKHKDLKFVTVLNEYYDTEYQEVKS